MVHPGVQIKAIESNTLFANPEFNEIRAHLGVEAVPATTCPSRTSNIGIEVPIVCGSVYASVAPRRNDMEMTTFRRHCGKRGDNTANLICSPVGPFI